MIALILRLGLCLIIFWNLTAAHAAQITDSAGRTLTLPHRINHIICSGSGCLRLVTYMQAQDLVVGVDDMETGKRAFDARPYFLANPGFQNLPVFGGFRGRDNPEKILGLSPLPQVIFKTYSGSGTDPGTLEEKTGIPVVVLEYGDLAANQKAFFKSLTILGQILDRRERADRVIAFFRDQIQELDRRTRNPAQEPTCFMGGIAFKGPHGFQSTEPFYPPFSFVNAKNIACPGTKGPRLRHSIFSKEKLLMADPRVIFLDLSTLRMGKDQGGLVELKTDPVYRSLTAVKTGQVFSVLPYNAYTQNQGSVLADAWYIGKILYPNRFSDIDPGQKADEIYEFLVSKPVFAQMNRAFREMAFKPVDLD